MCFLSVYRSCRDIVFEMIGLVKCYLQSVHFTHQFATCISIMTWEVKVCLLLFSFGNIVFSVTPANDACLFGFFGECAT